MVPSLGKATAAGLSVVIAAGLMACNEPQGANDNPGASEPQLAHVQLLLSQGGASSTATAPPSASGEQGRVTTNDVSSLTVTVTRVQFLRADSTEDGDSGWVEVALDEPATLDLLALPTTDESPIVFASGTVEAGSYRQVRLFVNDAQITFSRDLTVGQATFTADTEYPVTIPSVDQTGIKTDAAFDVVADDTGAVADVPLFFDPSATFVNATVAGSGTVMLAPVITANMGGS